MTSRACQLKPSRTPLWLMPRREPESRSDSPIKTRNGGGLTSEVGPGPIEMDDRTAFESQRRGRLRRDKAESRPAVAGQTSRTRWPPGRSSRLDPRLAPSRAVGQYDNQIAPQTAGGNQPPRDSSRAAFSSVDSCN